LASNNVILQETEKKLTVLNFLDQDFENIKKTYFEIHTKINVINNQMNILLQEKLEVEFKQKNLFKEEENFQEDKNNIDKTLFSLEELALKKQIMSDYLIYLLAYLKPRIEDFASEYFAVITDNRYTSISLDEDYNILIDSKNLDLYSG
jgi:uncharacterized protein YhaN